jgi:signal transduction histidine kinase
VVAIDQGYFSRVYEEVRLGKAGFVMLVGADGIVRASHGEPRAAADEPLDTKDLMARVRSQRMGSYVSGGSPGDPARIVSYRAVPDYPLIVAVGTGMDDALAQYFEHRDDYLTGVALIVALVWASFVLLGGLLVRQRRAAELLQEANERAESANRVKSEFLANMTHELRTPLNGIIGFADCLQEELGDESQRDCARIIYSSGCTLLGMVNSILDITKIEAGRMAVHLGPESVRLLVEEVVALHGPVAAGKGLEVRVKLDPDLPESFACDRGKLARVLSNLIHNAIKFTDSGYVEVAAKMDAATLVLSVKDTGCGISTAMHHAIFERFTQEGEGGVGLRGGTGLGLALARDLVHLMGGRMEVVSEPGQGAEFRALIPPGACAAT